MKTKLAWVAMVVGGLCIALGLIFGFSGQMSSSIPDRGSRITRWERELTQDRRRVEADLEATKLLGDKPDATPAEREQFAWKVSRVESDTRHLRSQADMLDSERGRQKEMILITAVLIGLGVLALVFGFVLRRRARVAA